MKNYFIIHGSVGKPFENWFPWLEEVLTKQGKKVTVPQFPSPEGQSYENWSKILKVYLELGMINQDTVFICHSLAPIFVCKFLIENEVKVEGIIAVEGFNELIGAELDKINKTFLMPYEELEKIIDYTNIVYCFCSDNDPYLSQEQLSRFVLATKGEKYVLKQAGHVNSSAGYLTFPEIINVITQIEGNKTFMENNDMPIGICAIVQNEKGQILLSKRKNRYGSGTYSLIGGKLKKGEKFESCIVRELKEEANLTVKEEEIEVVNLANTITGEHFVQIGVLVKHYEGSPENREPNKCEELKFFDLDQLPDKLFIATKPIITLFKKQKFYDKKENVDVDVINGY